MSWQIKSKKYHHTPHCDSRRGAIHPVYLSQSLNKIYCFSRENFCKLASFLLTLALSHSALALELSYGGRLSSDSGEPVAGPVAITFRFFDEANHGQLLATYPTSNVPLTDGVFQVSISLTSSMIESIFGDGSRTVYVEVEAEGKVYPRQAFSYAPLALRVPIDPNIFRYDSQGRLTSNGTALNGSGVVSSVAGRTGAITLTTNDLTEGANRFYTDSRARSALSAVSPLAYNASNGQISLGPMSGDISMASFKITSLGTPSNSGDAVNKAYSDGKLGGFPLDQSAKAQDSVIKWDSTLGKFYFGADQIGTTDSGIAMINGLGSSSQSLATSMEAYGGDTAPTWHSSTSSHTLNFPLASTVGVTGGLISKNDFDTFSTKQSPISSSSILSAGTVTSALQNGHELRPYASSAGSTGELRFDELAANGSNFVGFKAPDNLTNDTIWTLPSTTGSDGQVLSTGSSGVLSWITIPSAPVSSVASRTGAVTLSNADISGLGSLATASAVSGGPGGNITDGTITNEDISTAAAIDDTKLATIISPGKVSGNAVSGGTITATLSGTATNITGVAAIANGGTGAASATDAFDALSPLTTVGDLLYAGPSGTDARLPGNASNTRQFLTSTGNGTIANAPAWGPLIATDVPSLDASKITSGALTPARGGTGADLSSTGGSGHYLKQTSSGGPVSVGTISSADVPWAAPGPIGSTTASSGAFTTVTTTGNVGIGTTAPSGRLSLGSTGAENKLVVWESGSAAGNIGFGLTSNDFQSYVGAASNNFTFRQGGYNGTELMRISGSGNVGIGVTSPQAKLHISGQVAVAIPAANTPAATTQIIDWSQGNLQVVNLSSATGNVTLTLSNPVSGASYGIKVIQGANARNLVWPTEVKWPGGIPYSVSTVSGAVDFVTLFYDGSTYYAAAGKNYQ